MIHNVQNQMKLSTSDHMTFLLLNYMTKYAVFTRPCYYFSFRDENFKHDYKIDQSIEFSLSTTYWVGELDNYELHCCLIKYQSIHVAV